MSKGDSGKRRALTEVVNRLTGDSLTLPNLPEEIITEILLRLPVKSLLKFRCVSKSWLSLVSSRQFIKAHLKISTKNNTDCHNRLIFGFDNVFHTFSLCPKKGENSSVGTLVFDYPSDDHIDGIRIIGSCNGLICVALYPRSVILWNPATRKSKTLTISDYKIFPIEYGYGYDEINDDYRVFEYSYISRDLGVYETQLKVYSSRADSWRDIDSSFGKIFDGPGVFVNGSIHWKVYCVDNPGNFVVIAQNVSTETCLVVALPMSVKDDRKVMLGVSGGYLCASYDYIIYMDVWVLKESWTKLVCLPYFFRMKHSDLLRPKVLFVSENGGVLLNLGSNLIMYKPSQYHEIYHSSNNDEVEVEAATYSESLLSPDHLGYLASS